MKLFLEGVGMTQLLVAALLLLLPQDPAVTKAEKVLADKPDDPAANLTLGVHYSGLQDWEKAIPCLVKAKPDAVKAAAAMDQQNADKVAFEIGDAWAAAVPKAGPARQACLNRAS